jgi:hypothetical protein
MKAGEPAFNLEVQYEARGMVFDFACLVFLVPVTDLFHMSADFGLGGSAYDFCPNGRMRARIHSK